MSITAVMTWVIPANHIGIIGTAHAANTDEEEPGLGDQYQSTAWYKEVAAPLNETLNIPETSWDLLLTGFQTEIDSTGDMPFDGDLLTGQWGPTPVLVHVLNVMDETWRIQNYINTEEDSADRDALIGFITNNGHAYTMSAVVQNLLTGEYAGVVLHRWRFPDSPNGLPFGLPYLTHPTEYEHPENPNRPPGLIGDGNLFGDFWKYWDAVTSQTGQKRWQNELRGNGSQICSWCPNGKSQFCPAKYINDPKSCLGQAFANFQRCKARAETKAMQCGYRFGLTTVGIGSGLIGGAMRMRICSFTPPPVTIGCYVIGGGILILSATSAYLCAKEYKESMEDCYIALNNAFSKQAQMSCEGQDCHAGE